MKTPISRKSKEKD